MKKGLIQIYAGEGKGKTTAAVGLAVRARGHNLKVGYLYFHKDPKRWGDTEHRLLKKLGVDVFGFAEKHPHFYKNIKPEEVRQECLRGLDFIKKIYKGRTYDLLILDEINISVQEGFLKEKELLEILKTKPKGLELVLTGRGATKAIIQEADLVSEVKEVKHPYKVGFLGRKGIEY